MISCRRQIHGGDFLRNGFPLLLVLMVVASVYQVFSHNHLRVSCCPPPPHHPLLRLFTLSLSRHFTLQLSHRPLLPADACFAAQYVVFSLLM